MTPTSQKVLDKIKNDEPQEPLKSVASNKKPVNSSEKRRRKKISDGNSDIDAKVKAKRGQMSNDVSNIKPRLDKKRKVVETVEKSDIDPKSRKGQEQTSDDKPNIDPRFNSGQISNDMTDIEPRLERKTKLTKIIKNLNVDQKSKNGQYKTSKEKLDIDPRLNEGQRRVLYDLPDTKLNLNGDQLLLSNDGSDIDPRLWTKHDEISNDDNPDINSKSNSRQSTINDKDDIYPKGSGRKQALNHHLTNVNLNIRPRLRNTHRNKESDKGLSFTRETIMKPKKRPSISQMIEEAVTEDLDDLDGLINAHRFPSYSGFSPIKKAARIINEDPKIKQIPLRYTRETFEIMKGIAPAINIYKWLTENNILELLGKVTSDLGTCIMIHKFH